MEVKGGYGETISGTSSASHEAFDGKSLVYTTTTSSDGSRYTTKKQMSDEELENFTGNGEKSGEKKNPNKPTSTSNKIQLGVAKNNSLKGDGDEGTANVYIETDGVGHAYIEINGIVYSYGRYDGSDSPSSGPLGPTGPGVLIRKEGKEANEFIKERMGKFPTQVYPFKMNTKAAQSYMDNLYYSATSHSSRTKGVVVDKYFLIGNNCTTTVCGALQAGGINISAQTPIGFTLYMQKLQAVEKNPFFGAGF